MTVTVASARCPPGQAGNHAPSGCRVRFCAGTTSRQRLASSTKCGPGSLGKRDAVSSPGNEAGRRRRDAKASRRPRRPRMKAASGPAAGSSFWGSDRNRPEYAEIDAPPGCRVRHCAGTTIRLRPATRTMALPGSLGKRDAVSSPGNEAGRRRTIGVVAALSINPRATTPMVRRWVAETPKRPGDPEGRGRKNLLRGSGSGSDRDSRCRCRCRCRCK